MAMSSVWHLLPHSGEEKYQMLELNKRLESYLGHVKLLEEENQLLQREIQELQKSQGNRNQRQAQEEALSLARREVHVAWMEKDRVELEVSNILEEMEELNSQREKVRAAQAEAKRKLVEGKKQLEDEWRAQIWLREQAAHLEKEVSLQVQVHQEEMASLKSTKAFSKPVLMAPQPSQTFTLQDLGQEYSERAAQAWQEAAGVYQRQVEQLEDHLNQAKAHITKINQEKKESQLHLQDLAKELESMKVQREFLEKNMSQQKARQSQELQQLQVHVETLDTEKMELDKEIGDLMIDRRNLMQMKMCLGLEVATYRALLDSESFRVSGQSTSKASTRTTSHFDVLSKPHGTHPGSQIFSVSSHLSSPLNPSRSLSHPKANILSAAPSWSLAQSPMQTPKLKQKSEDVEASISEMKTKLERRFTEPPPALVSGTASVPFKSEENVQVSHTPLVSASAAPPAVDKPESMPTEHTEEDNTEEIVTENQSQDGQAMSGTEEAALISSPSGHLSSLPQTPERELPSNQNTEDGKGSEDGEEEEEETEVSTEMAQISHAPMFAWEENDTVIQEEKDMGPELELVSENNRENHIQECRTDTTFLATYLKELGEDNEKPTSPLPEESHLDIVDTFSRDEKESEVLTWADVKDSVANIPEIEALESPSEAERELIEKWVERDRSEVIEEAEVECCGTEVKEVNHSDVELKEEEDKTDVLTEENKEEERKEENVIEGEEEERMKDEDIVVMEENFTDTEKGAVVQDFSAQELENAPQCDSEPTEETALDMGAHDGNHDLAEDPADPEEEEQIESDEDESLNISASWRTDPGEVDSYAQENTIADTRPLLHYKSDEETDANTRVSHVGESEPSDSEEEREKHDGAFMWGQNTAKRFDTMEDLSEEPEIGLSNDVVMEESAQITVEENIGDISNEESVGPGGLQCESEDNDINVNKAKDDTLTYVEVSDFTHSEQSIRIGEETEKENQALQLQKQENSNLPEFPQSLLSETRYLHEQHDLPAEQTENAEDDILITNDNTDDCVMETFTQIKSDDNDTVTDPSRAEPSHEQALEGEPLTDTTHSEPFPLKSILSKEQGCPKEEEDEQSDLSMLTHADFTDNVSLHSGPSSRPESQTNIANLDMDESNSSEDESPNASQCSQDLSKAIISTERLVSVNEASKDNSVPFTDLLEEAVVKERFEVSFEESFVPQPAEWQDVRTPNKEEERVVVDKSSSSEVQENGSLPQIHQGEDLTNSELTTGISDNLLSTGEELRDTTTENNIASEKMDIFQSNVLDEIPQTVAKENDLHSFFSSSLKDDFWSNTKFETAATYDSKNQPDTEQFSHETIPPNLSSSPAFGEDWGEKDKDIRITTAQSEEEEEEREDQKTPQAKQLQCGDSKDGQMVAVQSDESVDEGDSWSSGEE
ncbi:nestin [Hoplias malabaricus]|uniref:nestin n=1 Tax=Hoplias malabaricus TaxID=27720 RepID=UPI003462EFD3